MTMLGFSSFPSGISLDGELAPEHDECELEAAGNSPGNQRQMITDF